jgi:DNA-binding response OmpR family regulator
MGEADALGLPVVLLIEDDPDLGPLIRDGLVRSGFAVELASTLEAALRRLGREPMPELIVLDLSLPDADGLEALRVLRALPLPGDPPSILVLTVY